MIKSFKTTTTTLTMKNKVTLKSLQEKLNRVLANKNPSMKKSSLSMIIGTLYAFSWIGFIFSKIPFFNKFSKGIMLVTGKTSFLRVLVILR